MRSYIVALALAPASCGADLPQAFEDAEQIELFQGPCGGSSAEDNEPTPELTKAYIDEDGAITGEVSGLAFRCEQEVCGYAVEESDTAKVLLQPCDTDPGTVASCDCRYDFDFKWEATSPSVLEVWARGDDPSGIELWLVDKDKLTTP